VVCKTQHECNVERIWLHTTYYGEFANWNDFIFVNLRYEGGSQEAIFTFFDVQRSVKSAVIQYLTHFFCWFSQVWAHLSHYARCRFFHYVFKSLFFQYQGGPR